MSLDHYSKNISLILEYIILPIPKENFILYLSYLYKSIHNDCKNIDSDTFYNINNFPLFISNKIFSSLTISDFLNENEFISFYIKLYYGNFYDKAKIVFDMLDFSKKKKIKKDDCIIFLYQFFIKKNKYSKKENLQLIDNIINNFFNEKNIITFGEYVEKIQNSNSDLLFLTLINLVYYKNFRIEQLKFFYAKTYNTNYYEKINYIHEYNYLDIYPIYEPSENLFLYFRKYLSLNQFNYYLKIEEDFDENLYELNRFEDNLIELKEYNNNILKKDVFNLFKSNYEIFPIHLHTNIEPETVKSFYSDKNIKKYSLINSSIPEIKSNENFIHIKTECMFSYINLLKSNKILSISEIKEYKTVNVYIQLIYEILFVFNNNNNKIQLENIFLLNKVLDIYEDEYFFCIYYINGIKPNILKLEFSNKNDKNKILNIFFQKLKFRKIEDSYNLMFEIGNGAFGKIYYSLSKNSNKEFAVKKINKNYFKTNSNFPNIRWEIAICQILSNIKHKNIIKVIDIYENLNECYVVFEFIKEGLADYISTTWPKKNIIIKILYQLADAVSLLNIFGIIHKDLKISNILISDHSEENFNIKLIDFGLSKVIGKYEYLKETTGTLIYISPEVINKKAYNFKEDVWTFGIIAYYLYKHKFPFNFKESILDTPKNIKNYQNQMDQTEIHLEFDKKSDKYDILIINIINMCLNKQIYFRPYIEDILNFFIKNENENIN